jgi:hypothetical protein
VKGNSLQQLQKVFTFANGGTIRYTYSANGGAKRTKEESELKARKEEQNYRNELHKQKEKI